MEDGKYGRAIINNSKNKIILNFEPDEARYVQDVLKLFLKNDRLKKRILSRIRIKTQICIAGRYLGYYNFNR